MARTLHIASCLQCPHFKEVEEVEYFKEPFCAMLWRKLPTAGASHERALPAGTIPEWCPLKEAGNG
jgi:hypothetical protein